MKKLYLALCLILLSMNCYAQTESLAGDLIVYKGSYFGQKPPGETPGIFMPELFNRFGYLHGKLSFSPDGKEVFWVITTASKGISIEKRLIIMQNADGAWGEPINSFLNVERKENGPVYSHDGKRIYYQSRAQLNGVGNNKDVDIWYRDKLGNGWSEPVNLGAPVNSEKDESQPWVASDGSIFFCRQNEKTEAASMGGSDIYYSSFVDGKYSEPQCLGAEINSVFQETEPCVSPDGAFILFMSNRPGGYSRMMNLYVSFRKPGGGWTRSECLSDKLKIENIWFPTITYDRKYLFFCGGYPAPDGGGYSQSNYYWVSTDVINKMNPFLKINNGIPVGNSGNSIKIICDRIPAGPEFKKGGGFSCLVTFNGEKILFDAGNERDVFDHNFSAWKFIPREINKVVISHNHNDHITSLPDFLEMNPEAKVYMSNACPQGISEKGIKVYEYVNKAVADKMFFSEDKEDACEISENIYTTGFLNAVINNYPLKEQSLVLDTEKGLVVITGCSHPGVVNIVKRASEIAAKPVYMLIGGFHLGTKDFTPEIIVDIIGQLKALGVQKCGASHCTGEMAINLFKEHFGKDFIECGSGAEILF